MCGANPYRNIEWWCMSNISRSDKLNILDSEDGYRSIPYGQYFGEMLLSDNEKEKRIELAEQLETVFLLVFTLIANEKYTEEKAIKFLQQKYTDTLSNFSKVDRYLKAYIHDISQDIIDATINNLDDKYYTSYDRAAFIAENEANSDMNYLQYVDAVEKGKSQKKWIDIRDGRERKTHRNVGGSVKPINEPFEVGNSLMMYPKDSSFGAEAGEIINCRCSIIYS